MNTIQKWAWLALGFFGTVMGGNSALAQTPDIAAGQKRAQACFACHGENGVSKIAGTPHLAGQDRTYLIKALRAYRNGQRQDPTMAAMAKPLSDADMVNIATYFHYVVKNARGETLVAQIQLNDRIKPVGTAVVAAAPAAARTADAIYTASCAACHASGAAGAPKLGDKAAWSARIAQGNDKLLEHALKGFNTMPAKGGCSDCSDDDIRKVVEHMVSKGK